LVVLEVVYQRSASGDTWNLTCWYRGAVDGVPTSNFADGLEVDFG
jgi:hypothetical protein